MADTQIVTPATVPKTTLDFAIDISAMAESGLPQTATWKVEATFSITGPIISNPNDSGNPTLKPAQLPTKSYSSPEQVLSASIGNPSNATNSSLPATASTLQPTPSTAGHHNVGFSFVNVLHPSEARGQGNKRAIRSHVAKVQHSKTRGSVPVPKKPTQVRRQSKAVIKQRQGNALSRRNNIADGDDVDADADVEDNYSPVESYRRSSTIPARDDSSQAGSSRQTSYVQRKGRSLKQRHDSSTGTTDHVADGDTIIATEQTMALVKQLRGGRVDPFWTYPIPRRRGIDGMVDHYITNIAVDIAGIDTATEKGLVRSKWFPLAMTDPAAFYSIMLMAATHQSIVNPQKSSALDLFGLKEKALAEVNSAVADPKRATSDAIVAAILKLSAYEAMFGDEQTFHVHMAGLQEIVRLRGGLPALGLDGFLERVVIWIDSQSSTYLGCNWKFDKKWFPSTVAHQPRDVVNFGGKYRKSDP